MAHQFNPAQFYPPQSQSQQPTPQQQQRKSLPLSQQQQFSAYDARMMMMPPPPPQQRPPSTRPGTAGRQQQPSLSQQQQQQPSSSSLFQQQHSPQQRFPSQGPFDPQYQQQQQQQLLHQQQQAGQHSQFGGVSFPIHHQQHPPHQQQFHPQIQPHSDGRLALHPQSQLQLQMQLAAQTQAQAQLHQQQHVQSHQIHPGQPVIPVTPTPMQASPSLRKRKLPHSPSPAPSQHHHHNPPPPPPQTAAVPGLPPSRMPPPVDVKPPPPSSAVVVSGPSHSQTSHLSLNPSITRISSVPLIGSGPAIPPLTSDDMTNMKIWIDRDKAYEQALNASRERAHRELSEALRAKIGWWEEEVKPRHKMDRERFGILWPDRKRKERSDKLRRAGIRSQSFKFPSRLRSDISDRKEDLIPIRLELDVEHHKLRETFVWNVNDPLVKPESLAQSIVDDFKLASHYVQTIAKAIHEQLQEHAPEPEETTTIHNGVLDSTGEAWWGAWRKRIRTQRGYVRTRWQSEDDADDESSNSDKVVKGRKKRRKLGVDVPEVMGETPMSLEELRPKEPVSGLDMDEEWRILIKA